MNQTEKAFFLEWILPRYQDGRITWLSFESIKLVVSDPDHKPTVFYTPDFDIMMNDGTIELIEIKGPRGWEEDARVKFRIAASRYPFRFRSFQRKPKKLRGDNVEDNWIERSENM